MSRPGERAAVVVDLVRGPAPPLAELVVEVVDGPRPGRGDRGWRRPPDRAPARATRTGLRAEDVTVLLQPGNPPARPAHPTGSVALPGKGAVRWAL